MVNTKITVRGDVDQRAIEQLERCAIEGNAPYAVMCADGHVGYSQPIGGAVAYKDFISPSGVGYDIGCGNKAVMTNLHYEDIKDNIAGLMDEIFRRVPFGVAVANEERVDHPVIERIQKESPLREISKLSQRAGAQLGSVGSGNHYVDLFRDELTGYVWIGVHFGSRGFGHTIASGFLALAAGLTFEERVKEGEMDAPPTLIAVDSELGQSYIAAMNLAGEYAYAGRDAVCDKVLEILGAENVQEIHNHHNFAWHEEHGGEMLWVVRKGCTPAFPGQMGFVGASMGENAVILEGKESDAGADMLYSTVHGAGRVMSRTKAAGRSRFRTVWECNDRDCSYRAPSDRMLPGGKRIPCPRHPTGRLIKRRVQEQIRKGMIDFDEVKIDIASKGIELRGSGADEAPAAYKRLNDVLAYHLDTIEVRASLVPIGVAMAGADVFDPFKD